jgi:hypothetical protein
MHKLLNNNSNKLFPVIDCRFTVEVKYDHSRKEQIRVSLNDTTFKQLLTKLPEVFGNC